MNYLKLHKRLKKASNIFVMGHKNLDLDALGACLAVADYARQVNRQAYVIVDDMKHESSIKAALEYIQKNTKIKIGKYKDLKEYLHQDSLLVVVDVFNTKRSQSQKVASDITNVIYIDHHLFGKPACEDYYIDSAISSTCELLVPLFTRRLKRVSPPVATIMLGGIDIDTNGYSLKVTSDTFDASSFLVRCGGDMNTATSFSKTKMKDYVKVQSAIFKTEFYLKEYAIVACDIDEHYEVGELATIADTLLKFNNVKATFVIGHIDKTVVGISARSNRINVEKIMKKYNGGGHKTTAAAQVADGNINTIKKEIKAVLK